MFIREFFCFILTLISCCLFTNTALAKSAISSDKCAIITGATKDPAAALDVIKDYVEYGDPVVIQSSNGYLAPSVAIIEKSEAKAKVSELISMNVIPKDSYCGNADRFIGILFPNNDFSALLDEMPTVGIATAVEDSSDLKTPSTPDKDTKTSNISTAVNQFCTNMDDTSRCVDKRGGVIRVLTLGEFEQFFDGKVYKTGSRLTGSSIEFSLDFGSKEYTILNSEGQKKTKKFVVSDNYRVCFSRGTGPCIENGFVIADADSTPTTGILKDTLIILGSSRRGKITFFDCGVEYIENFVVALPLHCNIGVSGQLENLMGKSDQIYLEPNEIAYIGDSTDYFDSPAIVEQAKIREQEKVVKSVSDLYVTYSKNAEVCEGFANLDELQDVTAYLINAVLKEEQINEDQFDEIKDTAWSKSQEELKNDQEHQFNKTLSAGLSKSKRQKACKEAVEQTVGLLNILKAQIEASKDTAPAKRKF